MNIMKCLAKIRVIYSGNVHGVGFRFTSKRIASRLKIKGFVKNLPDGTVEIVCEGEKEALEDFLTAIQENFAGYISGSNVDWKPWSGELTSFEIWF